jgi:hypothetical protein
MLKRRSRRILVLMFALLGMFLVGGYSGVAPFRTTAHAQSSGGYWTGYWTWDAVHKTWVWHWVWVTSGGSWIVS